MQVRFHEIIERDDLKFSVIVAKDQNGHVFVKHKNRRTWEIPGGHIENGESPLQAAKRELIEETRAGEFSIEPICDYSVERNQCKSFGRLYYAYIESYSEKLMHEIGEVRSFAKLPDHLTYPEIQPYLWNRVLRGQE